MILFKRERKALMTFKDYIKGRMDFDSFWKEYMTCGDLMKYLCRFDKKRREDQLNKEFIDYFYQGKPSFYLKIVLQRSIIAYLTKRKIQFENKTKEYVLWEKWFDYIPYFVPNKEAIFILLENLDNGKRRSKKYYRDCFSKIYQYEKYPPRWLQGCEWPIEEDGSPMKFLYQTGFPNRHDYIEYFFQKKDGSRVRIEQYI